MQDNIYFIAEMSANHAGNLDTALDIVRAAKTAGADCLKIQTYTADTLTLDCDNKYFRIKGGLWDGYTLYDLYKKAYTPWEWHAEIKAECEHLGMDFLSTPFDTTAVDFLENLNVTAYKIASFELVDIPLIEYTAAKGKPMFISCGMGSVEEIQDALDACKRQGNNRVTLLKCCSEYPANLQDLNLATIADMAQRFGAQVGFSDHSLGHDAAVVASLMGAKVIEKHFCKSRLIESSDKAFSMEPHEFSQMIDAVHRAMQIKGNITYSLTKSEQESTVFRRSVFAAQHINIGEKFTKENVRIVRPGYGLKPKFYVKLLDNSAKKAYDKGDPIEDTVFSQ